MPAAKRQHLKPPAEIQDEALLEWSRVCGELVKSDRFDPAHRAILILYVQTWQTWHAAQKGLSEFGPVVKYPNGVPGQSPFYKVAKEAAAQLRQLLNDLCLTPAAMPAAAGPTDVGDIPL